MREWPIAVDFVLLGVAVAHIIYVSTKYSEFSCNSNVQTVLLISYFFAIQGRTFQQLVRVARSNCLKLILLVTLAFTSISLGIVLGFNIVSSVFPITYSSSDCVRSPQLPDAFRGWRLYLWIADCMCFIAIGYLATVATYLEALIDYFEARYVGYVRLEGANTGLDDDELRALKDKEQIADECKGICGICLSEIEVRLYAGQ